MSPPGRFLAKMDVKMMISLNLITVEEIKEEQLQLQQSGGDSAATSSGGNKSQAKKKEKVYWYDVGDKKAREKASQCLRERNGAANEAVAALVKTVTASGEACPEDYATLMSKAAQLQQQQQQQSNNGGGGNSFHNNGANTNAWGSANNTTMGGGYPNMSHMTNGTNPTNIMKTEDDMIDAEIQRLLQEKQEQRMMMGGGNNNNNNMNSMGGGGASSSAAKNFGYTGEVQPYMGEESVMREYQALIQKQQELDARLANANNMMMGHRSNNGSGMMPTPYNTNSMGGMMGGSHFGNQQQQQQSYMQDAPQSISPNPNPNAARDYMNRLRMMRQGNQNIDLPFQFNNNNNGGGMPDNIQSASIGGNNMNNMGGGNVMNGMNNMSGGGTMNMNNMGGGGGGVNSQNQFSIEDYQASLQEFLHHDDGNANKKNGNDNRENSMNSQATQRFDNTNDGGNNNPYATGTVECIRVPTNLNDGNRRSQTTRRNSDRSIDDIDLPIGRNTFKSVDSDERPSFQSMDDLDIGGSRDTFRSVDTMDLMSLGASLNEIVEEELNGADADAEKRRKNSRRLSATSFHSRYAKASGSGGGGGGGSLNDYAHLPGATVEVKTMSYGQGGGGGPKKIKKAIDPRLVAMAGKRGSVTGGGTKGSMLSTNLDLDGIDDPERMSFGNFSVMSGLTDVGDYFDVKGLGDDV